MTGDDFKLITGKAGRRIAEDVTSLTDLLSAWGFRRQVVRRLSGTEWRIIAASDRGEVAKVSVSCTLEVSTADGSEFATSRSSRRPLVEGGVKGRIHGSRGWR